MILMRKKIIVKAPILSRSGYGEQSRFALRALRSREDLFDIFLINIPWGKTGTIANNSEERQWIEKTLIKTGKYARQAAQFGGDPFDISLQITIPVEFEPIAPINIGYTAGIETNKVAASWISKSNEVVNKIITISEHSKNVLEKTRYDIKNNETGEEIKNWGLQVPVDVVNYPVLKHTPEPLDLKLVTDKNFLVVSQWGPRKNLERTIRWFVEEYKDREDVGLIIKANTLSDSIMDREYTSGRLHNLLEGFEDKKCKVYLVHGEISSGQLTWLYQHPTTKALINIAHGEGYGLPMFEAAYNGLPLVTLTWSGQMDFICKQNKKGKKVPLVVRVDYDLQKVHKEVVWKEVIEEDSMWAYAREASYKRAIREVLTKEVHFKKKALELQKHILKNFTEEKLYSDFVNCLSVGPAETAEDNQVFIL